MTAVRMQPLQSLTTPPKRPLRFYPSERLSERKRALFPSQDSDSDSDLGHMSPLEQSSSPERFEHIFNNAKHENRYFTLSSLKESHHSRELEKINDENDDPLPQSQTSEILAPNTPTPTASPEKDSNFTAIPETPIKSPTQILKTPHDNSNTNLQLPRLVRKSLLDISNFDKSNLKRKSDSPVEESGNKSFKLDHSANKVSKARTALFTENIFPAKSFYPKTETNKHDTSFRFDSSLKTKHILKKPAPVYLCSRGKGKSKKNFFGQINAGVRHGIKKPKHKPALTKTQLLKAALNIVKNSPLNDILDNSFDQQSTCSENECGVSLEQIQKMDSILKNLDTKSIQPQPNLQNNIENTSEPEKPSLKRPLSPQPDSTKKFFKSGPSRATVTINDKIKLKLDHGEISLIEKQHKIRKPKKEVIEFEPWDFSFTEDNNKLIENSFTDILKSLEDDQIVEPSIITSHNSIVPISSITKDMLLSPTSLVCDLTSGLALDSPKSQPASIDKLTTFKKCISFPENMTEESQAKLFPIFYGKQNEIPKQAMKESKHVKNIRKIWKPLSEDQTLIDAGQKKFGLTQCPECKVVYSLGEPEDEIMHFQHHNAVSVLRYNGWKHERVVNQFHNGKVIQINPNDPKTWWRKVKDLLEVINRELGFVDVPFNSENKKVFLCIMNKQIVGCLVSEAKSEAHKMISSEGVDQCSEEAYPVKCGVSRIWVAAPHRNKGVATCLMNAMRSNFMYGHILSTSEIAFSAPTELGKRFAEKYTKNESFLIYTS